MTKKYLLDANIYGEMVIDKELRQIRDNFEALKKEILVYGINSVIRKELRNTPKKIRIEGKNLRNFLLILYDSFTKDHQLAITEDLNKIADAYYTKYRELGGSKSKSEMTNDFLIVACASKNGMNIIVSQDEKSMRMENAVKAYKIIDDINKFRTPEFIAYEDFKKILRSKPNKFIGSPDKVWVFLLFFNLLNCLIQVNLSFFPFHNSIAVSQIYKLFA